MIWDLNDKRDNMICKAITNGTFENLLNSDMLSLLVMTYSVAERSDMFDNLNLSEADKKILDNKIKEFNKFYEFKNKPFES